MELSKHGKPSLIQDEMPKKYLRSWCRAILKKRWPFSRNSGAFDYSKYFGNLQPTAKRLLIEKCMRYGVPVFVDDANETVAGIYAELRAVASEAEIDRRPNARLAMCAAIQSNWIAALALVVSLGTLAKSVYP